MVPDDAGAAGNSEPPGWRHRRQMRQWMRALTDKTKAIGAFDRDLHKTVNEINNGPGVVEKIVHDPLPVYTEPAMTNRTGFGGFAGMIRQQLDSLKQEASNIQGEMGKALAEGEELAQVARKTVNDVKSEIAEAKAAFGQLTNGGPE